MSIQAMKQALEALKYYAKSIPLYSPGTDAITALRAAIEAAEKQEPVAWMYPDALCDRSCLYVCTKAFTQFPECANTTPQRTWVGLTDEEIDELHGSPMNLEHSGALKWVRIIEAKLKEKNT